MGDSMPVMMGKRGLVMGVANDRSIAWGIAKAVHHHGGELAFTYQGDALLKRINPLANSIDSDIILPCDVTDEESVDEVFSTLSEKWGKIDFLIHAIAFSDREELKGAYIDTSAENFSNTLMVSCYSFTTLCRKARRQTSNKKTRVRPSRAY